MNIDWSHKILNRQPDYNKMNIYSYRSHDIILNRQPDYQKVSKETKQRLNKCEQELRALRFRMETEQTRRSLRELSMKMHMNLQIQQVIIHFMKQGLH